MKNHLIEKRLTKRIKIRSKLKTMMKISCLIDYRVSWKRKKM